MDLHIKGIFLSVLLTLLGCVSQQTPIDDREFRSSVSHAGDPCADNSTCTGNMACYTGAGNGYCTCMKGFHLNESLACEQGDAVIGDACKSPNIGCEYIEFSTCRVLSLSENGLGFCDCDRPYHGEQGDQACVQDSLIGGFCNQSTECGWFMQCSVSQGEGHCICTEGCSLNGNNTCSVGAAVVGSYCFQGYGCEFVDFATCVSDGRGKSACTCSPPYQGKNGDSACLMNSRIGDFCNETIECFGNTVCNVSQGEGYCTCMTGYHLNESLVCEQGDATVGSVCTNYLGCENVNNSMCSNEDDKGRCICEPFYHGENGDNACVLNENIGDPCSDGFGCMGNMNCNASRGLGYCTCRSGFHANEALVCVAGNATVGSTCTKGLGCENITDAECSSETDTGKCICSPGYHEDDDGACTQDTKLGDACPNGNDCTGNTECIGGFCTCKMGNSAGDDLVCKAGDAAIGSTCMNNVGCERVPNSNCSERTAKGKCTCEVGFHAAADRKSCERDSHIGDPCVDDSDCIGNAMCNFALGSGLCTCKNGFHTNKTLICYPGSSSVGSFCSKSLGCEFVGNSSCSSEYGDGMCECVTPFFGHDGDAACTLGATLGESCDSTKECLVEKSICQNGKCVCETGYLASGNVCRRKCNRKSKQT